MVIRWDSESDWKNSQDSSGTVGRNGNLKQGYSRERPDLSDGLVGYWPLHDDSATDYSGNNNHGSLNGGVTTGVAGKGGLQAMSFDGNDDYVDISGAYGAQDLGFTISAWAYRTADLNTDKAVISGEDSGQRVAGISGSSSTEIKFSAYDGSGHGVTANMDKNRWYHLVGKITGSGDLEFFVDGESVGVDSTSNLANNTPEWYIGAADLADSPNYWPGKITNVRIYNRVLTDTEIQKLYNWGNGDFARPLNDQNSSSAVSRWAFDGDANDSWSSNDGNDTTSGNYADGVRNQAKIFEGSNGVIVSNNSNLEPSNITVSAWAKHDNFTGNWERVLHKGNGAVGYGISETNSAGQIDVHYDDGTERVSRVGETLTSGNWYHIVMTWNGSNLKVYLNGVDTTATADTSNWAENTDELRIGERAGGDQGYWKGLIDDVRIYDSVLSSREIFQLYRYGTRGRDMRRQLVNY